MSEKREQERNELFKTLWDIANKLRGAVDGWDFKQYVLGMICYRFLSEEFAAYIERDEREAGNESFCYADMSDEEAETIRDETVKEKGFFILPSQLFRNLRANARSDEDFNTTLHNALDAIEKSCIGTKSEANFKGIFSEFDTSSAKLGDSVSSRVKRLRGVIDAIAGMQLGYNYNEIDTFGDAYEYLMGMYAANAGKSGGEYFTPQEVSELLTYIAVYGKERINKIYDPACGSGSLLLKAQKLMRAHMPDIPWKLAEIGGFYGQEINLTTFNLCRMNMILHGVEWKKSHIALGDTLTRPQHRSDEPFEAIVSNPPYSIKWDGDGDKTLINDERYAPAGVLAPKSTADLAFIMHSLSWLSASGRAAIVCFPGVMYRGGAERKIRSYLIDNNFIDAVIQLPTNLFFGTSIATCIMVLSRSKKDPSTLFIDASKEFVKVTKKNVLTPENIAHIVNAWAARADVPHFARLVPNAEIAKNDYNISVSTYVEQEDTSEKVDIAELNAELARIVMREDELRKAIDAIVAELEGD